MDATIVPVKHFLAVQRMQQTAQKRQVVGCLTVLAVKSGTVGPSRMSLPCASQGSIDRAVKETKAGVAAADSSGLLYQQGWWLDIARGQAEFGQSQVSKDGKIVGALSYIETRSVVSRLIPLSFSFGGSPHWTSLCQPLLAATLDQREKREVLEDLIRKLPRKISFKFVVEPDAKDRDLIKDAFKSAGFEHTIQTTYSERPGDIDARTRLSAKHRYNLRRAERDLEVLGANPREPAISAAAFVDFYEKNLLPGEKSYAPLDVARALIEEGQKRHQAQVFVAQKKRTSESDANGCWDAAIACVWDDRRLYYWMSSRRRESPNTPGDKPHEDAIKLLMITAMSYARSLGRVFDVDGVPIIDGCPDQGKNDLYKKILKIPHEENRDVYRRPSPLYRAFTQLQEKLRYASVAVQALLGRAAKPAMQFGRAMLANRMG
jgi:hypothetical protein